MKVDRVLRGVAALGIVLLCLLAIAALVFVTESTLNVWDRLSQGPRWIFYLYFGGLGLIALGSGWAVWRFVVPRRRAAQRPDAAAAADRESIQRRLEAAAASGVDTGDAQRELDAAGTSDGVIDIAFAGEISAGKSSLIRALLPAADVSVSPVGGSTGAARRYRWTSPAGVEVRLVDLPGFGSAETVDAASSDEAMRAHLAVYVCDGDLTRQEIAGIDTLLEVDKPVIVALNKVDHYDTAELDAVRARIHERLLQAKPDIRAAVVPVSAGGDETVITVDDDGNERTTSRAREPDVAALAVALNDALRNDPMALASLRDRALFRLAADKLQREEQRYRKRRSEEIVRGYTRKAVVGALAAVSPGTDIVIQGYLGSGMARELCRLYGQAPRDLDIEKFLDLSQSRVGKALPLTLAVAGNGLKAFPGVGTIAGGLVHAVAYGLIFDALGRSLALSLAAGEGFSPAAAAADFESSLGGQLEGRVARVVRLALGDERGRGRGE